MKKVIKIVCIALTLSVLIGINVFAVDTHKTRNTKLNYVPGTILVSLKHEYSDVKKNYTEEELFECFSELELSGAKDLTEKHPKDEDGQDYGLVNLDEFKKIFALYLPEENDELMWEYIEILNQREDVDFAQPDYIHTFEFEGVNDYNNVMNSVPNDTAYSLQWGLNTINASTAWDYVTNANNVLVGVIDSGIDVDHADLMLNINSGLHRDFTGSDSPLTDEVGHGTHVAGIIGARGNNAAGVTGVCWRVGLVSLKVLERDEDDNGNLIGTSPTSRLINAIEYAENNNIEIVNYSIGSDDETEDVELTNSIRNYHGLLICSAGNNQNNLDINPQFPAANNLPNLITVASINSNLNLAGDSNYSSTRVDLVAPGVNILSTYPISLCDNNINGLSTHYARGYHRMSGTSMATPFVTGTAALIKSLNPNFNPELIRKIILEKATVRSNLSGYCSTSGVLNAGNAVAYASTLTGSPVGNFEAVSTGADTINVSGWAFDYDNPTQQLDIHVYVGGSAGSSNAIGYDIGLTNIARADVNNAHGITGNHGFNKTITTTRGGTQEIYVYAINVGNGSNKLLGHITANLPTGSPRGSYESASGGNGTVTVGGWAFDYDVPDGSVNIHVYVGGPAGSSNAIGYDVGVTNVLRTDVNNAYGITGNHGFNKTITTSKRGVKKVYVYAINRGSSGENVLLGYKTVVIY